MSRPWKLAIASGKGGTGKTTVSLSLSRCMPSDVVFADCDVEEPNQHLFLGETVESTETDFFIPMPSFREQLCEGCGICAEVCEFGALAMAGNKPIFFEEMCHSCGACSELCPQKAFVEKNVQVGSLIARRAGERSFLEGNLVPGYSHAPRLIQALKKTVPSHNSVVYDCPPGASCATHAALEGSDFVVLVTEPTPFGLHDLQAVLAMVNDMSIPYGVVINRDGLGNSVVDEFCQSTKIPVLARIPFSREAAEAGAAGNILYDSVPSLQPVFQKLRDQLLHSFLPGGANA